MTGMNVNAYNYAGSPLEHRTRLNGWREVKVSRLARSLVHITTRKRLSRMKLRRRMEGRKGEHCIATQNNWQLMETHSGRARALIILVFTLKQCFTRAIIQVGRDTSNHINLSISATYQGVMKHFTLIDTKTNLC